MGVALAGALSCVRTTHLRTILIRYCTELNACLILVPLPRSGSGLISLGSRSTNTTSTTEPHGTRANNTLETSTVSVQTTVVWLVRTPVGMDRPLG